MIIQPFVENSILHGLLPKKEGDKKLIINFKKTNGLVICEIDDNGIGRLAASKRESIHTEHKKSRGMEVTLQRLKILSENANENTMELVDKRDANGNALGTTVIIKIPT